MKNSLIRAVLSTGLLVTLVSSAFAGSYVLKNLRIVDSDGTVVENGMIIVSGDKIVHVGAPTSYEVGFTEIDCTGKTAYPGFINAYSTDVLDLPESPENAKEPDASNGPLPSFWHENRKGVFADIDASQHIAADELDDTDFFKQGITAALLTSGLGAFSGRAAVVNLSALESGQVVLPRAFQEMSFRSGSGSGYPGSPMARIALMRQLLFNAEHYVSNPPTEEDKQDAALAAIGDAAIGLDRTLFNASSERDIQRAFNLSDEFGLKLTIYGGLDAWQHATALKQRGVEVILDPDMGREPSREPSEDPIRALNDPPQEVLDARYAQWADDAKYAIKLNNAGIRFAFGGDDLLDDVRKHIAIGLPKDVALKALTINAAEILGVANQLGSLTKGKLANIVLMSGDFADEDSEVTTVFVAGKMTDLTTEED